MACLLGNGRAEVCKDVVGGLEAIYFINYGDITAKTYDVTDTDMISTVTGVSNLYKFELKGTNSFEQTINSSRENGTTFVEQTLSIQLKKQNAATTKIVKLLAYGRPNIVVKDNNGNFFLAGLERGMDVTLGDVSGYQLTFVGQEKIPANFLDAADEAALITLFGTATIVTS
jgi:hypothetical protein